MPETNIDNGVSEQVTAPVTKKSSNAPVLYVDDDGFARDSTARILKRLVCKDRAIEVCASAREAIQKILEGLEPAIILSDVDMVSMSGSAFYKWLGENRPDLAEKIIFLSGGAYKPDMHIFIDIDEMRRKGRFVDKPFECKDLSAAVDRILSRGDIQS
jgi:CheY-like chemotaxis protein